MNFDERIERLTERHEALLRNAELLVVEATQNAIAARENSIAVRGNTNRASTPVELSNRGSIDIAALARIAESRGRP